MSSNHKKTFALPVIMILVALALFSFSPKQTYSNTFSPDVSDYAPLAPIEGTYDPATGKTNLSTYLTGIFKVGVAGAGVLAFLMIVWGGFTYLSTDVITGKEEGKARIERAVGGLILALTSYIILNTINPKLVELDLYFGEPAAQKNAMTAPSDITYSQRLDNKIAEINKILDETKATAQPLEKAAFEAKLEQNEIMRAYAEGELDDLSPEEQQEVLERLKELDATIKTSKTQAQAVRDYNTALAVIKNSTFEAVEATLSQSGAKRDQQADLHVQAIQNKAKVEIQTLEKAAAADPSHKQQYQTWADDLRSKFGDSIRAIRKAQGKADDKDLQNLQNATLSL